MKDEERIIFELQMLNSEDMKYLKQLENEGILKRVIITADGKLDKRTVKKW